MTTLSISSLPDEVMVPILLMLDPVRDCTKVTLVCRSWHRLEQEPSLWHFFCLKYYDRAFSDEEKEEQIDPKRLFTSYFQRVSDIFYLTLSLKLPLALRSAHAYLDREVAWEIKWQITRLSPATQEKIWHQVREKLRLLCTQHNWNDGFIFEKQSASWWADKGYQTSLFRGYESFRKSSPDILPLRSDLISENLSLVLKEERLGNPRCSTLYNPETLYGPKSINSKYIKQLFEKYTTTP